MIGIEGWERMTAGDRVAVIAALAIAACSWLFGVGLLALVIAHFAFGYQP